MKQDPKKLEQERVDTIARRRGGTKEMHEHRTTNTQGKAVRDEPISKDSKASYIELAGAEEDLTDLGLRKNPGCCQGKVDAEDVNEMDCSYVAAGWLGKEKGTNAGKLRARGKVTGHHKLCRRAIPAKMSPSASRTAR